jgi:heme exporter protein C
MMAFLFFFLSFLASIAYLIYRRSNTARAMRADAFALANAEMGVAFCTVVLITGPLWARPVWGIWWTWDARLSSMLLCWLVYVGYLFLRRSVEEPTQRAQLSAVLSILGCINVAFVYKSIEWYRTQHPSPVLSFRNGGDHMGPGLEAPIWWNWLALVCLGVVIAMVRMQQGEVSREIDALRRQAHSY